MNEHKFRRRRSLALGETHILRGPFFIRKHHAVDDFDAGEPTLATRVLQFSEDDVIQLLAVHEILQSVALNAFVRGELLECWLGRHDDGNGLSFIFRCIDTDVRNNRGGTVDGFELCRTLVLATIVSVNWKAEPFPGQYIPRFEF